MKQYYNNKETCIAEIVQSGIFISIYRSYMFLIVHRRSLLICGPDFMMELIMLRMDLHFAVSLAL